MRNLSIILRLSFLTTLLNSINGLDMILNQNDSENLFCLREFAIKYFLEPKCIGQNILFANDVRLSIEHLAQYDNLLHIFHDSCEQTILIKASKGLPHLRTNRFSSVCRNYVVFLESVYKLRKLILKLKRQQLWSPYMRILVFLKQSNKERGMRMSLSRVLSQIYSNLMVDISILSRTDDRSSLEIYSLHKDCFSAGNVDRIAIERCESGTLQNDVKQNQYSKKRFAAKCMLRIGAHIHEPYVYSPNLSQRGLEPLLMNTVLKKLNIMAKYQYNGNSQQDHNSSYRDLING